MLILSAVHIRFVLFQPCGAIVTCWLQARTYRPQHNLNSFRMNSAWQTLSLIAQSNLLQRPPAPQNRRGKLTTASQAETSPNLFELKLKTGVNYAGYARFMFRVAAGIAHITICSLCAVLLGARKPATGDQVPTFRPDFTLTLYLAHRGDSHFLE
ncbi:MAG: hypothetical protein NZ739_04185 [Verrucomicrobiae bacterium]|nr:hypothetical protein [Verrucomicrobiae bacterium]MDW7979103.1 hypothetical protein [Verrucomicrobiales bacterium]